MIKTQWNEKYYSPPPPKRRDAYASSREAVLSAVSVGTRTVAEMCSDLAMTRSAVAKQLLKLADQGLVRRVHKQAACGQPQEWELV